MEIIFNGNKQEELIDKLIDAMVLCHVSSESPFGNSVHAMYIWKSRKRIFVRCCSCK